MKNRVSAIFLAAAMVFSAAPAVSAADQEAAAPEYIYLNESFDDYESVNTPPEGWNFYSVGDDSVISGVEVAGREGRSVKMYNNAALDTNMSKVFGGPVSGDFVLETKFRCEDYNVNRFLFSAKDVSSGGFAFFQISGEGKIKSGDWGFPYKTKKWYTVAAAVHTETKSYDVYINGQVKEKNLPLTIADVSQFKHYIKGSPGAKSSFYIDDTRVYSGTEPAELGTAAVNAENGTPDASGGGSLGESESGIKLIKRADKSEYIPPIDDVYAAIGEGAAFFLGSPNVYVEKKRQRLDEADPSAAPFIRDGSTVLPASFVAAHFPNAGGLPQQDGYVGVRDLAAAMGQFVYWDDRGLIVLTEKENPFDPVKDSFLIDEILKLLIYERPAPEQIVADLSAHSEHPRVMADKDTFDAIRKNYETNEYVKRMVDEVKAATENFMDEPPIEYDIPDGRRLKVEKEIKVRLKNLGLLWQVTGDKKYPERAWKELQVGAAFPDWNDTREFLNTAGMMEGFAIAYDWMYDYWSKEQKAVIRNAIVEKGIKKGLAQQESGAWWMFSYPFVSNWTSVCNGGLTIAACAVGDEIDPDITGRVIKNAMTAVEDSLLMEYAPDGGWGEGPGYWGYTFSYLTILLSSLDTACGTTYGLIDTPGLTDTAYLPINLVGPKGSFNYGDSGVGTVSAPEQFFIAKATDDPDLAGIRLAIMRNKPVKATAEDVVWFTPDECNYDFLYTMESLPKDKYYRGTELVLFRSGWDDNKTVNFMGFKGGHPWGSHRHMDSGNFVIDALGQRWAQDLGSDDYGLTGYFNYDQERFHYYRMGAEGHNIVLFSPKNEDSPIFPQELGEIAPVTKYVAKPKGAYGVVDLSKTYKSYVNHYERGFMLGNFRSNFTVQDEIETKKPCDLTWQMHTKADVEIFSSGKSCMLTQGKERMLVTLTCDDPDAVFEVGSAQPPANSLNANKQNKNEGYRRLIIKFKNVDKISYAVNFLPLKAGDKAPLYPPALVPLADWSVADGDIIYPKVEEITIGGAPFEEFDPLRYNYTVSLPNETTEIPAVAATGNQKVVVTQAETIPGTATVSVINEENTALATNYYIAFKKLPKEVDMSKLKQLPVKNLVVSAEPQKENPAASMLDGDLTTRWSAEGEQWAQFDLGEVYSLSVVGIAFYNGDSRAFGYTIQVSEDGETWQTISEGESSGSTQKEEKFTFDPTNARYVKILGHGNTENTWNSYSVVNLYGMAAE